MVKIERPQSIFGKYPYGLEQTRLDDATTKTQKGVIAINPTIVGIPPMFIKARSEKERLEKARAFFRAAKKKLESIGV